MDNFATAWPAEPYLGLAYYGAKERLLFSGRDEDVDACIHRLTSTETRILLIHGHTGCGKSSFLRAGLIPAVEESGAGYLFLRNETGSPLFIRCGSDPLQRIAEQIFHFARRPVTVGSARGDVELDLSEALLGHDDMASYVEACRKHGALKNALRAISTTLPATLVIILDQAEEVITLDDATHANRRQFFRFIKEFGTINFPVKLIIALRKDYSGQFVELAQVGGSIDLRERPAQEATDGNMADATRSDVKLFLLPEFGKQKVEQAIELPTSKNAVSDQGAPFDRYRFVYEPGVVAEIVKDLFEKSSTAVLPVMQIVCRDLYNTASSRPGASVIDARLYADGGKISGPVDRHISKSLRTSFGKDFKDSELAQEECAWRDVLSKLVRRESDGTVHTRVVKLSSLREIAAERGTRANVDRVVQHLTTSEVLLLRNVTSATDTDDGPGLSLGHDFIAMVLSNWKTAAQASEIARQRARRVRNWILCISGAVFAVIVVGAFLTIAYTKAGMTLQAYNVLVNTAVVESRDDPPVSMLASAYATIVATQVGHYQPWSKRDDRADRILARLLAGLPETTSTPSSRSSTDAGINFFAPDNFPLPESHGFLNVSGDDATMTTSLGPTATFKLEPFAKSSAAGQFRQETAVVSEIRPGTALLLRTSGLAPNPYASDYQIYVLSLGRKPLGPFGANYFLQKAGYPAAKPSLESDSARFYVPSQPNVATQLDVSGGRVVVSTTTRSTTSSDANLFHLRAFAFNAKLPVADAFELASELPEVPIDARASARVGLPVPLLMGDYAVLRESTTEGSILPGLMKYDLRTKSPVREKLADVDTTPACPNGCAWQWISSIDSGGTAMVFAAARLAHQNWYDDTTGADLKDFRSLLVIDVATGRQSTIGVDKLNALRASCDNESPAPMAPPDAGSSLSNNPINRMFVARGPDASLLGVVNKLSFDFIRLPKGAPGDTGSCIGTLSFGDALDQWVAAPDGTALFGVGRGTRATWRIDIPVAKRADTIRQKGALLESACAAGLGKTIQKMGADDWLIATRLPEPTDPLCTGSGPVPRGAASEVK